MAAWRGFTAARRRRHNSRVHGSYSGVSMLHCMATESHHEPYTSVLTASSDVEVGRMMAFMGEIYHLDDLSSELPPPPTAP